MPDKKTYNVPILAQSPSVISLYFRLTLWALLIGVLAVIAGVVSGLLEDRFANLYRKWLNYLE